MVLQLQQIITNTSRGITFIHLENSIQIKYVVFLPNFQVFLCLKLDLCIFTICKRFSSKDVLEVTTSFGPQYARQVPQLIGHQLSSAAKQVLIIPNSNPTHMKKGCVQRCQLNVRFRLVHMAKGSSLFELSSIKVYCLISRYLSQLGCICTNNMWKELVRSLVRKASV